jgi:hypothetical protein
VEIALAALALVVALAALVAARRRTPPSPREPAGVDAPPAARPAPDLEDSLRRRVEDLEARCLALEARPAASAPTPEPVVEAHPEEPREGAVERRLRERGFEDVRVEAEGGGLSPLRVEARRGGTVYKGQVDPSSASAPEERLRPARRAFP